MNNLENIDSEESLQQWMISKYKAEGVDDLVIDGSLNKTIYRSQRTKILFIYLETYGYQNCGIINMVDHYKEWIKATGITKTFRHCSLLAYTLFQFIDLLNEGNSIPDFSKLMMQESYKKVDSLTEAMERTAFINIRKTSNYQAKANYQKIHQEFNSDLIRKQIAILNPDVIITGGKDACRIINGMKLFGKADYGWKNITKVDNTCVATITHLSRIQYQRLYNDAVRIAEYIVKK